ncbi:MAG: hypothetical protein Alpg2KO_11610 [Alphaproteobacteria bacterium]
MRRLFSNLIHPEFTRQSWADGWMGQAVVGFVAPVVLLWLFRDYIWADYLRAAVLWTLWLLIGAGCVRVVSSVSREIRERTWEAQCFAGHDPFRFMLAKWLGPTWLLWLGCITMLAIGVAASPQYELWLRISSALIALMLPAIAQLVALGMAAMEATHLLRLRLTTFGGAAAFVGWAIGFALNAWARPLPESLSAMHAAGGQVLKVYSGFWWQAPTHYRNWLGQENIWSGLPVLSVPFKLLTLSLLLTLALVAMWRIFGREFHNRQRPLAGPVAVFFIMLFGMGFAQWPIGPVGSNLVMTGLYMCAGGLAVMALIYYQRRPGYGMVRLRRDWRRAPDFAARLMLLPGWVLAIPVYGLFVVGIYPVLLFLFGDSRTPALDFAGWGLAATLLLTRDGLLFSLMGQQRETKTMTDQMGPLGIVMGVHLVELIVMLLLFDQPDPVLPPLVALSLWAAISFALFALLAEDDIRRQTRTLAMMDLSPDEHIENRDHPSRDGQLHLPAEGPGDRPSGGG